MSLLDGSAGRTLESPIGPFLPADWNAKPGSPLYQITFGEIMSHTSGVRDQGPQGTYQYLQQYFTTELCIEAKAPATYCGLTFGLLRVVMPKLAGYPDCPSGDDPGIYYAIKYVDIINARVFSRVNVGEVTPWIGDGQIEALAYADPAQPGYAWSSYTPQLAQSETGAGGLFASLDDLCPVLESLCAGDGKILTPSQWLRMRTWNTNLFDEKGLGPYFYALGLDGSVGIQQLPGRGTQMVSVPVLADTSYLWLSKNGGAPAPNKADMEACIAFFGSPTPDPVVLDGPTGPVVGNGPAYGVMLINSYVTNDVIGPFGWCQKCSALVHEASSGGAGQCPAGGTHVTYGGSYVIVSPSPSSSWQPGWRTCKNCNALWFTEHGVGACSAKQPPGPHEPGELSFSLPMNGVTALPPGAKQNGWRWCSKCEELTFPSGGNPPCAADEPSHVGRPGVGHDLSGSADYVMGIQTPPYVFGAPDLLAQAMLDSLEPNPGGIQSQ
jgi:hypothetical protein